MRKIIVLTFITLDGVMQAPGGPDEDTSGGFKFGGWTVPYFDDFAGKIMEKQMSGDYDLLLGRKTFDIFASYWPTHTDEWPTINTMTKHVVSNTVTKHAWENSNFIGGEVAEKIRELKTHSGPDLQVHGSGVLVQTLMKYDLIDEFWLKIFPVTLGSGKRLFAEGTIPAAFELTECQTSPFGVIFANYKRVGEVKTGTF
jgi:dihydrofolate reductase